jgi:pimeloyl-ACP methyl ester carboxylesterase
MNPFSRREFASGAAAAAVAALAGCAAPRPAKAAPAHFVLVHGAWHGAWCWSKVVPLLRAEGHMVTAVDLPGRWYRPEQMAGISPDQFVETVGQVLQTSPQPVVLVGHSLGGSTISLTAERYPDHIRRLVYLTAFLVASGDFVGKLAAADKQSWIPRAVRRDPVTSVSTIDPARAREVFYQDCSDDDVRIATQLLSAEPAAMGGARMNLTAERFGRIERAYIECLQDRAIPIDAQRAMQSALPCKQVRTMDTSHSPFFSKPVELVSILSGLAA